jgi:hypothetical protein
MHTVVHGTCGYHGLSFHLFFLSVSGRVLAGKPILRGVCGHYNAFDNLQLACRRQKRAKVRTGGGDQNKYRVYRCQKPIEGSIS